MVAGKIRVARAAGMGSAGEGEALRALPGAWRGGGALAILPKPFYVEDIGAVLSSALGRSTPSGSH